MTDGFMVDANIILAFYNDYREKKGQIYDLIIWIISDIGIAINSHISTEWKETCSADVFLAWYIDQLKLGTIRNVVCDNLPHHLVKKMVQDHGFPANTLDIHYINCAYNTGKPKYIITLNYDFFEPSCRKSSLKERRRARENREGRFCHFLDKKMGIRVGMPGHCRNDFKVS